MTKQELVERQNWTLDQKIDHALGTIEAFVNRLGSLDKVYLSFSGGKDSTVLLHLARMLYPDILAVFCNTGNEHPDVVRFVRESKEHGVNLEIIRPPMTPRQVWEKYGFPLVGKETACKVRSVRYNPDSVKSRKSMDDKGTYKLAFRWRYLINEPYAVSEQCCHKLKKEPFHKLERKTGRMPILGIMAGESMQRQTQYLRDGGCNVFGKKSASRPLAIWREQDIWDYIKRFNVQIAEVYNKGAQRTGCVGCGFGSWFKDDERFDILYREYPKLYEMVMNYTNNGVKFRDALRKTFAIYDKTLPDEHLFTGL